METRVTSLLRKSVGTLYDMYKETQAMLEDLSAVKPSAKVEELDGRSPAKPVRCIKLENMPKRRKLLKKKESEKVKRARKFEVEHIDELPQPKAESLKRENIKAEPHSSSCEQYENYCDSAEEIKDEEVGRTKEEYSCHGHGGYGHREHSHVYNRRGSVPYNAVEFVDLQ